MPLATPKKYAVYRQAVVRQFPVLLIISFMAAIVAATAAQALAPAPEVHFSYLVSLRQREEATEYRFDGYYALQATDLFATTLASWVHTPEIIAAAYQQAGLVLTDRDPRSVRAAITATKSSPQLVEITVRQPREADAQKLAAGLQAVMNEQVAAYHAQGIPALTFGVVVTTPWVGQGAVATRVITAAAFIFTFIAALNVVLFQVSLRLPPD